jgi:hypothetical protein
MLQWRIVCVHHVQLAQAIHLASAAEAAGFIMPSVGVLAGLTLLLVGGRLLRPGLALAGTCAGILAGLGMASNFDAGEPLGVPSNVLLPCAGALVGWALALALFRFAIAVMSCVMFAGLGVLGATIALRLSGHEAPPVPEPPGTVALVDSARGLRDAAQNGAIIEGARNAAGHVRDGMVHYWNSLPESSRPLLMLGLFGGAIAGLVIGSGVPRGAGALVMSLTGSAAALGCSLVLLDRLGVDFPRTLTPPMILTSWAALGLLGLGIQLASGRPGRRGAPAPV